jgi:outer membrane protein TolC
MRRGANSWRCARGFALAAAAGSGFLLTSCAAFSPDGGMDAVKGIVGPELARDAEALRTDEQAAAAHAAVKSMLKRSLTAGNAARIALLNNRSLQASYNALGIAEAVYVQATQPPVPRFSVSRIAGGGGLEIEGQIAASILALATLPARTEIAGNRFRRAQLQTAIETLRIAAVARRSFYRAVAARELETFLAQALTTAETATQLSKRLRESGAMTKLDQARNQVFYAELAARLAAARQRTTGGRERLIRALGLWGSDLAFRIPGALPPLPAHAQVRATVEIEAVRRRVDLQIARLEAEALAKTFGLKNATRVVNLVEASAISKTTQEPSGPRVTERGAGVEFEVPIYDFGEARLREAGETYMQAVNRLFAKAVNVRSEAREAYLAYRSSYDIAQHYRREVLPLRKIISDETLLRYNAMQIDVFSLLAEARQRIGSITAAIEAQQNFWLAEVGLSAAITFGAISSDQSDVAMPAAAESSGGHN